MDVIERDAEAPPAERPRRLPVKRMIGGTIFAIIAIAALTYGVRYYLFSLTHEWTDDAFIEGHVVQVSPRVAGHVAEVRVNDNDLVRENDVLVVIDPADFRVKRDAASSALAAAKATGQQSTAEVAAAQAEATRTASDLGRYRELAKSQSVSPQQLEAAEMAQQAAAARLLAAKAKEAASAAQVTTAQSALDQAELDLKRAEIRAPSAGRVTRKGVEEGAYYAVGQAMLAIVPQDYWVVANLKETQLTYMRPGQEVQVHVDAYPSLTLDGKVQSIQAGTGARFSLLPPENATGNFVKVVQRVPVKITFDKLPEGVHLAPGMSVVPEVKVK
jgi:membrane fusion protein, multidrug efflux system